jgi:hypothetical protein
MVPLRKPTVPPHCVSVQQSRVDVRLTDTTPQEVVLALRATGASDEDVLYAAKTEFAEPFRFQKIWGVCLGVLGLLISLTGVGAILGVPMAGAGIWIWRKSARNLAVVDSAFATYRVSAACRSQPERTI